MLDAPRPIASHAADSDYAPRSSVMLSKLGYLLLPPEEAPDPALRVVREDRLGEVPPAAGAPIILLRGARPGPASSDARILATVRRPIGLHELYGLIQAALEKTPRSVPRVPTALRARRKALGEAWPWTVRSLSESGCLLEADESPALDEKLELEIELPWGERIGGPAVVAYEQNGASGLVFHNIGLQARQRIARAVLELLDRL